jgi:hypothetical protein
MVTASGDRALTASCDLAVAVGRPVKEASVLNVVVGVNDDKLDASHVICTAASCTTNCIAPVIKVYCRGPRSIPYHTRPDHTISWVIPSPLLSYHLI